MADEDVLRIFKELAELHKAKDADYCGGEPLSNFKRCEQFGIPAWKGVAVRLSDKWSRFVSLASSEGRHCVKGESLDDTLADIAVYAVICLALRRKESEISVPWDRVKWDDGDRGCGGRWNDVNENQVVGEISVSGDRVKRESLKLYPDVKLDGTSWDKAKREPHVYENADSVGDDDSVITSQDECAKRFAEGEAVRRNYAGIND